MKNADPSGRSGHGWKHSYKVVVSNSILSYEVNYFLSGLPTVFFSIEAFISVAMIRSRTLL